MNKPAARTQHSRCVDQASPPPWAITGSGIAALCAALCPADEGALLWVREMLRPGGASGAGEGRPGTPEEPAALPAALHRGASPSLCLAGAVARGPR